MSRLLGSLLLVISACTLVACRISWPRRHEPRDPPGSAELCGDFLLAAVSLLGGLRLLGAL